MPSTQALERALRTYGTAREQVRGDGITNGATALATALGVPLEPDKVRALSDIIGTSHILPGDSLLNAALNLRGNENIRRFRHRHGLDLDREQYPLYMEISLWGTEGKKNEPQIVRIFTQNYQTGTQFETFYLREETESEAGDRSVTYKRYDATLEDINHDLVHQDVEGLKVNPFSTFSVQFNIPLPQEQSSISISEPAQSTTTAESVNDSTEAAELVQAMEQALGLEQSTSQPSTRVMEHVSSLADEMLPPAGAIMTLPDTALDFFPPTTARPAPEAAGKALKQAGYQPIFQVNIISSDGRSQPYIAFCQGTVDFFKHIADGVTDVPVLQGGAAFTLEPTHIPSSAQASDIIPLRLVNFRPNGEGMTIQEYGAPAEEGGVPAIEERTTFEQPYILPPVMLIPADRVALDQNWRQTAQADAVALFTTTIILDAMRAFSTRNSGVIPEDNTLVVYPGIEYNVLLQLADLQSRVMEIDGLMNTPVTEKGNLGPVMIYMLAFMFTALDMARRAKLGDWTTGEGSISLPPDFAIGGIDAFAIVSFLRTIVSARRSDRREHAADELDAAVGTLEHILSPFISDLQNPS